MEQVYLDKSVLDEKLNRLSNNADKIELEMDENMLQTDIRPFSAYVELIKELKDSLFQYQELIRIDAEQIRSIGSKIEELDANIAIEIAKGERAETGERK